MDKQTLSNYGWIVICVLVLAVMIALAGPFGNFVADAVKSTTQGLFDVNQGALDAAGIVIDDNGFADGENGAEIPVIPDNPIPEGGAYTITDGTTLNAGEAFPETVTDGDIYTYGDYKYTYQISNSGWKVNINTAVIDKSQTTYGEILENINDEPVTSMASTFKNCTYLVTAPIIPSGVTDMGGTFEGCSRLTTTPVIPSGVTNMSSTFYNCASLTKAPAIPNSVTSMNYTFYGCALTTAPTIPNSVKTMSGTFWNCISLKGTIKINANPITWTKCLYNTKITAVGGTTTMADNILLTKASTATNPTA